MSTKFYFRIWVVICGLAFAYGYVRRITLGDDLLYFFISGPQGTKYYNWFDNIVNSIYGQISLGEEGLPFRISWGLSTLIVVGLSTLLLGLAIKWIRDSIDSKG
jgi:hypothetical protein